MKNVVFMIRQGNRILGYMNNLYKAHKYVADYSATHDYLLTVDTLYDMSDNYPIDFNYPVKYKPRIILAWIGDPRFYKFEDVYALDFENYKDSNRASYINYTSNKEQGVHGMDVKYAVFLSDICDEYDLLEDAKELWDKLINMYDPSEGFHVDNIMMKLQIPRVHPRELAIHVFDAMTKSDQPLDKYTDEILGFEPGDHLADSYVGVTRDEMVTGLEKYSNLPDIKKSEYIAEFHSREFPEPVINKEGKLVYETDKFVQEYCMNDSGYRRLYNSLMKE